MTQIRDQEQLDEELREIRRSMVRECATQGRLGRTNNELRMMGFSDGCIIEARRFLAADESPYNYNNPPVGGVG